LRSFHGGFLNVLRKVLDSADDAEPNIVFDHLLDFLEKYSLSKAMSALTSSFGLFQFSMEKAYRVRIFIPNSLQAVTTSLTASTPLMWPLIRLRSFFFWPSDRSHP